MLKAASIGEAPDSVNGLDDILKREHEKLLACVHCGLCLQSCPTYLKLGDENDSPRGRLYLMRAVSEDRASLTPSVVEHLERCLQCRACEVVCPSGMQYGMVMESAREVIAGSPLFASQPDRKMRRWVLRHVFTNKNRLRLFFGGARLLQRSGLARLLTSDPFRSALPEFVLQPLRLLASIRPFASAFHGKNVAHSPSAAQLSTQHSGLSVSFFEGCVMPILFGHVNDATRIVLEANGWVVHQPRAQGCCGALHLHNGDRETARALARRNIDAFKSSGNVPIVVNAAGCGAAMKEYGDLLAGDSDYCERAKAFSKRVKDISEFLAETGVRKPEGRLDLRVTYSAPCHLAHVQRVKEAPLQLLRAIDGVEIVPMKDPEVCCGSAGTYNLTQPEMSARLREDKVNNAAATSAQVIATGNPGCQMQIGAGLLGAGSASIAVHPIEILAAAYTDHRPAKDA